MKKLIALLFFVAFSTVFVSAQDRGGQGGPGHMGIANKETAGDQISQVVTTVFDKTSEAVKSLSEALKVPAERVYTVLTKQQAIVSVTWLSVVVLFLIAGIWLLVYANSNYNTANKLYVSQIREKDYRKDVLDFFDDDHAWSFQWVFGIIIFCVGLIIAAVASQAIFTGFLNPEYGAIKEIMSIL